MQLNFILYLICMYFDSTFEDFTLATSLIAISGRLKLKATFTRMGFKYTRCERGTLLARLDWTHVTPLMPMVIRRCLRFCSSTPQLPWPFTAQRRLIRRGRSLAFELSLITSIELPIQGGLDRVEIGGGVITLGWKSERVALNTGCQING